MVENRFYCSIGATIALQQGRDYSMEKTLSSKIEDLLAILGELKSAAVAFSGGADSTFLAAAALKALGKNTAAVTAASPTLPARELEDARAWATALGIRHVILPLSELGIAAFAANGRDRCYHCKKFRFEALVSWAGSHGFRWILDGSNVDDLKDYRPGMKAISEMKDVRSPLLEAGFTKEEIRRASEEWGLPSSGKPASACLASRIAYGIPITMEALLQVDRAEEALRKFCPPHVQLRVRHHGSLARIETDLSMIPLLASREVAEKAASSLKSLGFSYVTLDLSGYRMGSLNELPADRDQASG